MYGAHVLESSCRENLERVPDHLELVLLAIVRYPLWVFGTEVFCKDSAYSKLLFILNIDETQSRDIRNVNVGHMLVVLCSGCSDCLHFTPMESGC